MAGPASTTLSVCQGPRRPPGPLQRTHAISTPIREDRRRSLYHEGDCMSYTTILGLDLGKFKSVCCAIDVANKTQAFETIQTTPAVLRELLSKHCGADPSRVLLVIETCDTAGWVHALDLKRGGGFAPVSASI